MFSPKDSDFTASTGWHGSSDPDLGPGQRGEDHHPQDPDLGRYLPYHAYTGLQHQEHHAGWLQVETRLNWVQTFFGGPRILGFEGPCLELGFGLQVKVLFDGIRVPSPQSSVASDSEASVDQATQVDFLTFLPYWTWMSFFLSWSNLGDTDGETNERDLKPKSQAMSQHYINHWLEVSMSIGNLNLFNRVSQCLRYVFHPDGFWYWKPYRTVMYSKSILPLDDRLSHPFACLISMTPAKERVGHRRAGSHPTLLEQLLWEHWCSWDSELLPPEIKLGTSQIVLSWWPFSSFVVDKSGHFRCKDFHRLPVTQENWGHWHHFSICFSPKTPTPSPHPPIPSHPPAIPQPSPQPSPSPRCNAVTCTAGPGLRGGLLGHATPGGELAGAEATAGGGEVGRSPALEGSPGMLMLEDDKVMEMDGNGWKWMEMDGNGYVYIYIHTYTHTHTHIYIYVVFVGWVVWHLQVDSWIR